MDLKVASTIGFERANQALLQVTDEDEFVEKTTSTLGPQPPNFENIVALNRGPAGQGDRRRASAEPAPGPAGPATTARSWSTSAPSCSSTRRTSPAPSASPPARAGFGSKLAWLAKPEQPIVLVGRDDEDAIEAAPPRRRGRPAQHRRLPRRRHDLLARGEARRRPRRADDRARAARALGHATATICRSSTSASRASGTPATSPGSVHEPYHDIRDVPDGHRPRPRRSRSSAAPASARRSPRACSSATAASRSSTSSRAACRCGSARAGRPSSP